MTDDDDLLARLRRADPAAALAPVSPSQVAHLVEEAMSRKTRTWVLPVAAALVLIAGGTAWAVTRPDAVVVSPMPALSPAPADPTVRLTAGGDEGQARCARPEPEHLAERAGFAFEGTVSRIEDDVVTLTVSHVFRGPRAGTVEVTQPDESTAKLILTTRFRTGSQYLIASADGDVMDCGYSGESGKPGLRELYEAAF